MNNEKKLAVALLTEKLKKMSGKEVVFEKKETLSAKDLKIKKLVEALEKVSGKKVVFEKISAQDQARKNNATDRPINPETDPNLAVIDKIFYFDRFDESGKAEARAERNLEKFHNALVKKFSVLEQGDSSDFDGKGEYYVIDISKHPKLQNGEALAKYFKGCGVTYMGEDYGIVYENQNDSMDGKELEEGFFGPSEEDVRKKFLSTIALWATKGYKKPTQAQFDAIMAAAKADKLKGKLGVDKEKNIIYRPYDTINWVPSAGHTFGGGAGN